MASPRDAQRIPAAPAASEPSSNTAPVSIPEPKVLPYSRLSLRAHSVSSISPSQRSILAAGSPTDAVGLLGSGQLQQQQSNNPMTQLQGTHSSRQQPNKRPPLPPSPQARLVQGSCNPLAAAWINPTGGGSGGGGGDAGGTGSGGSGSAGRQPRILSAAAAAGGGSSSYSDPSILSSAGGSSGSPRLQYHHHPYQQQQQQQQQQYACSSSPHSASPSPGGGGILAAAVLQQQSAEDMAAAAGNPYHPRHDATMQLLMQHQQQQLQQLQQLQRDPQHTGFGGSSSGIGAVGVGGRAAGYMRSSSFGGGVGQSPGSGSPRLSPRAPSRNGSFNRLSELGTSPGLIEASFMGMAARASSSSSSNLNNIGTSSSRSATLQQLMLQQQQQQLQAAGRAQQQQRGLQHSRSTVSFEDWQGSSRAASGSSAAADSRPGSRPQSAGTQQQQQQQAAVDWDVAQQQQQQQQQGYAHAMVPSSLPGAVGLGDGRGMRALPGRPGVHWLSRADDGESVARGLLGLPRPGLRATSSSSRPPHALPLPLQQQQGEAGGGSGVDGPEGVCLQHGLGALAPHYYTAAMGTGSPRGAAPAGSPAAAALTRGLSSSRSFGRLVAGGGGSSTSTQQQAASSMMMMPSRSMSRSGSFASLSMPTCLICLDQLTPADFESGEAMYLACACKGEVALRHRHCAEKWSQIKGNTTCDVCRQPILNLPDVPLLPEPLQQQQHGGVWGLGDDDRLLLYPTDASGGLWGPLGDEPPAAADYVFDCTRVTWVVLIVCILFFELPVLQAFIMGAAVGCGYVALTAALGSCRRWRRQRTVQDGHEEDEEGGGGAPWLTAPLLLARVAD